MDEKLISISIIEDNRDYRDGLSFFINSSPGFKVSQVYASADLALEKFLSCDILLLDINLPGTSGVEAIKLLKAKHPEMKIIMMTIFEDEDNIINAIQEGADGYLLKKTSPLKILSAIEDVFTNGASLSASIAVKVLKMFRDRNDENENYNLTGRETEILSLLVAGNDNRQIADLLFISYDTVRNHLRNIYSKLNVTSKTQAVAKAIKENIIKNK